MAKTRSLAVSPPKRSAFQPLRFKSSGSQLPRGEGHGSIKRMLVSVAVTLDQVLRHCG